MSELKRHHINEVMDMHNLTRGEMGYSFVYYADDADAEIAELKADYKEACDRLQTANLIKDEQLAAARHNKYKRCLGKAEMCESEVYHIRRTPLCEMSEHEYWRYENDFWQRWHKRWLKLAEKFKEAK